MSNPTPITGVIQNNNIIDFISDYVPHDAIDLDYHTNLHDFMDEHGITDDQDDRVEEFNLNYMNDDASTYLIGDWVLDPITQDYSPNPQGKEGFAAIVRPYVTQVVFSKHITLANHCSPCYPGQGDLDTPGTLHTYTLPPGHRDEEYLS